MTRCGFLFFSFWGVVFLCATPAQAHVCPAYNEPEINVVPSINRPIFNHAYSAAQLEELQYQTGSYQNELIPSGLTTFAQNIKSSYEFREAIMPNGTVCAQVSHITLTIAINELTVHIASELPVGSCSYNTILDHEMKHVHMAERFLNGAIAPVKRQLHELLDSVGMIRTASSDEARRYVKKTVGSFVDTLSKNLVSACNSMEQSIDTKEEYTRLSKSCNGEMGDFARRAARNKQRSTQRR